MTYGDPTLFCRHDKNYSKVKTNDLRPINKGRDKKSTEQHRNTHISKCVFCYFAFLNYFDINWSDKSTPLSYSESTQLLQHKKKNADGTEERLSTNKIFCSNSCIALYTPWSLNMILFSQSVSVIRNRENCWQIFQISTECNGLWCTVSNFFSMMSHFWEVDRVSF